MGTERSTCAQSQRKHCAVRLYIRWIRDKYSAHEEFAFIVIDSALQNCAASGVIVMRRGLWAVYSFMKVLFRKADAGERVNESIKARGAAQRDADEQFIEAIVSRRTAHGFLALSWK